MPVNTFDHYPLSWKPDKSTLTPPYYQALAEDLTRCIRSGALRPGTKLPPQREIADYLDLHYTTITRVYNICKAQGLLYGSMGKGTYVATPPSDGTLPIASENTTLIDLSALNNFSEHTQLVKEALAAVIARSGLDALLDYYHPLGQPHQLATGVRWLEQLGVHTDTEHLAIVSGGQNALMLVLLSLFSRGDCIAVEPYTYACFIELARMLHIRLLPVDSDAHGMRPDALDRCAGQVRGVYLMPSCTNPTTLVMPEERRAQLSEVIRRHRLLLIEDDIGSWMAAARNCVIPSLYDRLPEQTVYIGGTSKSLCPGLRVAYLVFAEAFRAPLRNAIANGHVKTSALDAEVITELILSGAAKEQVMLKYHSGCKAARCFLRFFPRQSDETCTFFRWLPIPQGKEDAEEELRRRGVLVFHSRRFAVSSGAPHLRLSISSAGSIRRLEQGLAIVRDYLSE